LRHRVFCVNLVCFGVLAGYGGLALRIAESSLEMPAAIAPALNARLIASAITLM